MSLDLKEWDLPTSHNYKSVIILVIVVVLINKYINVGVNVLLSSSIVIVLVIN